MTNRSEKVQVQSERKRGATFDVNDAGQYEKKGLLLFLRERVILWSTDDV